MLANARRRQMKEKLEMIMRLQPRKIVCRSVGPNDVISVATWKVYKMVVVAVPQSKMMNARDVQKRLRPTKSLQKLTMLY
jgi:hypothetical protein